MVGLVSAPSMEGRPPWPFIPACAERPEVVSADIQYCAVPPGAAAAAARRACA